MRYTNYCCITCSARGTVRWLVRQGILLLLPLIVLGSILLYMNGGPGGQNFPNYTTQPLLHENKLEVIASLPSPPGNLAIHHDQSDQPTRIFFTYHPEYAYSEMKLAEYNTETHTYTAYPNQAFQSVFKSILSVRIDYTNNVLYCLDFAHYGMGTMSDPIAGIALTKRIYGIPKLFGFSLTNNSLVHEYEFSSDIAGIGSMLNDFVISPDGTYIYIADTSLFRGTPSLVIYHIPSRSARRVLDAHPSMFAEQYTPSVEGSGPVVAFHMFVVRPHVDSIGLSNDGKYLFYAPFSHEYLYRIETKYLHDTSMNDQTLDSYIEIYSKKSISDGIILDQHNNVYLTDIEHSCINMIDPQTRSLHTLIKSQTLLRWPDGLSFDHNQSYLYITASALHLKFRGEKINKFAPYHILRVKVDQSIIDDNTNNDNTRQSPSINVINNDNKQQSQVGSAQSYHSINQPQQDTAYQNIYGEL